MFECKIKFKLGQIFIYNDDKIPHINQINKTHFTDKLFPKRFIRPADKINLKYLHAANNNH